MQPEMPRSRTRSFDGRLDRHTPVTVSEKNYFGSMASGSEGTDKKPGYLISETTDFVNGVDLSVDVLDIHFSRHWSTAECPGDRTERSIHQHTSMIQCERKNGLFGEHLPRRWPAGIITRKSSDPMDWRITQMGDITLFEMV